MGNRNLVAVETFSRKVLVIENNQVIGKGVVHIVLGAWSCGVRFEEGVVLTRANDLDKVRRLGYRDARFHYNPQTGHWIGTLLGEAQPAAEEKAVLGNTFIVDEENFLSGVAPDHFKAVPGFGSANAAIKAAAAPL